MIPYLLNGTTRTVILRSEATKNLFLSMNGGYRHGFFASLRMTDACRCFDNTLFGGDRVEGIYFSSSVSSIFIPKCLPPASRCTSTSVPGFSEATETEAAPG
jgi:hypothetical protein